MKYDPYETPMIYDRLQKTLTKIGLVASHLATYEEGNVLASDGMYYILDDAIEEIKELFEFTKAIPLPEPKPQPLKRAA